MKRLTDLCAAADEFVTGRLDVGYDEIQVLHGAGRGRRDALAEVDRAR
jgi:hypothetical protein